MAASADTFPHTARLATGDWVVLRRPDAGPLGFLAKVTDGEWDPRDDALLRARVDTTATRPLWFAVGDLERVEPADEAGLVEAALLEGLVPADRAERLRADVAALRDRTLTFVRSPGLLDRLWAALPTDPAQRSGGLAAFFDEGRRALHDARSKRWAPAPTDPAPSSGEAASTFALPDDFEIGDAPDRPPVADTRPASRFEAVHRVLHWLPRWSLAGVVERLDRSELRLEPADTIRATLLGEGLSLERLLGALSPFMIRSVPPLLGLPEVKGLADRVIEAWVLGTFRNLPERGEAPEASALEVLVPLPPWTPPLLPSNESEAKWRVLGLVRGRDLAGVAERFGEAALAQLTSVPEMCLAIASSRRDLRRLLFALPERTFLHAPWALGLPPIDGPREGVVEELVGRWPLLTAPARTITRSPDLLLPHVVRALTLAELTLVLLNLRSQAPVDPATLVATLRAEGHGVRDVLSHLGPGALRRVATACGVPESIEAAELLHAAILSLEPSPFA